MDKESLEHELASKLGIPSENSNIAFSMLKEKIAKYLSLGEAIKIDGLGVFQLKEQLSQSTEDKTLDPKSKDLTLLFSPEASDKKDDFLFLNIDLKDQKKDDSEFSEDVFQLGIGKPIVSQIDDLEKFEQIDGRKTEIEEKIDELLVGSEKIKDFDLWDDYLQTKETTSIIDEIDEQIEGEKESETSEISSLLEDDFEPVAEEEIINELIEESDIGDEESEEVEELIKDSNEIENSFEDDLLEVDGDVEVEVNIKEEETSTVIDELDEAIEQYSTEEVSDDVIQETVSESIDENQLTEKDDTVEIDENIKEKEIPEEVENIEEEKEQSEETTEEEDEVNIVLDDPESSATVFEEKQKSKKLYYLLIPALLIISAVIGYYLFYTPSIDTFENGQTTDELISEGDETISADLKDAQTDEPVEDQPSDEIKSEGTETGINDQQDPSDTPEKDVASTEEVTEEREVSQNIFYDGYVYNVQVSSWKQRIIADREVEKLIKRGYPAFIIKVYIKKFDGTWHRVRVGPYTSLAEAKNIQAEIKK